MADEVRPGLRQRKRRDTAARIEAAALLLFEQRGFEDTTVDHIAEAADVSRATVFRYFGSKDDIVYAVEPDLLEVACRLVRQTPHLGLDQVIIRYAEHIDANVPDLHDRAEIIVVTPRLVERFAHVRTRWDLAVARELAARRSATDGPTYEEQLAASLAVSVLFVAFLRWATMQEPSLAAVVRRGIDALPGAFARPVTPESRTAKR